MPSRNWQLVVPSPSMKICCRTWLSTRTTKTRVGFSTRSITTTSCTCAFSHSQCVCVPLRCDDVGPGADPALQESGSKDVAEEGQGELNEFLKEFQKCFFAHSDLQLLQWQSYISVTLNVLLVVQGRPTEASTEAKIRDYGELESKDYIPGAEVLEVEGEAKKEGEEDGGQQLIEFSNLNYKMKTILFNILCVWHGYSILRMHIFPVVQQTAGRVPV